MRSKRQNRPPARPRVSFRDGRPIVESLRGAPPASPPPGRCRVCRRNPPRAHGEPCLDCADKLMRAEVLGIYAGYQERRRLGLVEERPRPSPAWLPALLLAVFAAAGALPARAGTLTGKFVLPTSATGVKNGTLTLALSQAAVVPGSFVVVPETVACYTSIDGSVVGLPNPASAPVVHAQPGGGTLPAATYFVVLTYVGDGGETLAGPETQIALGAPGAIEIDPPLAPPSGAASYNIYIGTASGAESKQGGSGFVAFTQSLPLGSGGPPPANNTTVCTVVFNDATLPAPTYYSASLADAAGNVLPGFPQSWYLSGASVDVSQLEPLTANPAVRFPTPLLSNPASSAAQSLDSALNLNGFAIGNTGNLGPGIISGFWSGTLPAPTAVIDAWTPNVAIVLRRLSAYAQTPGGGGTGGTTLQIGNAQGVCSFSGLLVAAATSASNGNPTGFCSFAAGLPLTLSVQSDDHTTRPANVAWKLEVTAQ